MRSNVSVTLGSSSTISIVRVAAGVEMAKVDTLLVLSGVILTCSNGLIGRLYETP
jgi:hypothetical protein